ncbi:MAG: hypothetical protein CFE44_26335, partial [Burkholderiales bacterium PBB4]
MLALRLAPKLETVGAGVGVVDGVVWGCPGTVLPAPEAGKPALGSAISMGLLAEDNLEAMGAEVI